MSLNDVTLNLFLGRFNKTFLAKGSSKRPN